MTIFDKIVYESGNYWVSKSRTGFEIYKICPTHSTKVATIGFTCIDGEERYRNEILRREILDETTNRPIK